jgi:hypothetical protein
MHYTQLNLFDVTPYQKSQVAEAEIDQPSQAEILIELPYSTVGISISNSSEIPLSIHH